MKCSLLVRPFFISIWLVAFAPASSLAGAVPESLTPGQQSIVDAVEQFIVEQAISLGGETTIYVSAPANDLPGCQALDVYMPAGRKLASKTTVAVRCLGQDSSPIYVRSDVQVHGSYFVPAHTIDVNRVISVDMLEPQSGDLLALPRSTHIDPSTLIGRIAKQRLISGQPIRTSSTRSADSIERGQPVKIEVRASGFTVTNQGEALSSADVGSPIRIKTEQGKIVQGIVQGGGVVTMNP